MGAGEGAAVKEPRQRLGLDAASHTRRGETMRASDQPTAKRRQELISRFVAMGMSVEDAYSVQAGQGTD